MDIRTRRARKSSQERPKVCMQPKAPKPIRKVQVVYYLTRNGQLEHPHYMEVTHLVNQPLCLKDVMERLTALRGKRMPSLYSWSCKRSYKNGYVWNDLADNDIIPPSDGAEYVLKGSELVEGCSERIQQLQIRNRVHHLQEPAGLQCKQKSPTFSLTRLRRAHEAAYGKQELDEDEEKGDEYELDEEKTSYTSSTTTHSRCSRGVSTDELEDKESQKTAVDEPAQQGSKNSTSKRLEDGEAVASGSAAPSRNSVLLQLIACGNIAVNKAKNLATMKQPGVPNNVAKKSENLQRGVLCKCAVKVAEDDQMINCMSENPRFGKLQAQEKEYFSGSILEYSMNSENPVLKKSSSYNEERSGKAGLGETVEEEIKDKTVIGKCLPRKKSSQQTRK